MSILHGFAILPRALFTCLSKKNPFEKSPRQLTTARLKMDIDGGGNFEDTYGSELEKLISPALLRVSKRESLA